MRAAQPLGRVACNVLRPSLSPVTRPSKEPSARVANALVTFRRPTVILTCLRSERRTLIATSAEPPLTRSARPERTEIDSAGLRCFAAPAGTVAAQTSATRAGPIQNRFRPAPLLLLSISNPSISARRTVQAEAPRQR